MHPDRFIGHSILTQGDSLRNEWMPRHIVVQTPFSASSRFGKRRFVLRAGWLAVGIGGISGIVQKRLFSDNTHDRVAHADQPRIVASARESLATARGLQIFENRS